MSDKKVIKFGQFIGWHDGKHGSIQAVLGDIKAHYRLGDQPVVTTSAVLKIDYNEDRSPVRIETLNTIYEKE